MPKARKHQISLEATPYYHCTSRCVRRAFLCGVDHYSGQSYEHRREWVEAQIKKVSHAFCIDVCAYAVMSNHLHLVLHINTLQAEQLSELDVCLRWHSLFKGTHLTQRFVRGKVLTEAEEDVVRSKVSLWREQLLSISWFMRCVNEPIARLANAEDQCTGSFWESRFSSQALLDEKALAACLAYVDLNPIRAKMASTPENSEFTSVKTRIEVLKKHNSQPSALFPFIGNPRKEMPVGLPFKLKDYLDLVDWTGRILRGDKRGAISNRQPAIMERLGFSMRDWERLSRDFEGITSSLVGGHEVVRETAPLFGYKHAPPKSAAF